MKIVLIGCGAVGKAFLELLPICKLISSKYYHNILIIEPLKLPQLNLFKQYKIVHKRISLHPDNIDEIMKDSLMPGDVVIDASVNVDAIAIMKWCNRVGCIYINTSMENWLYPDSEHIDPSPDSLYDRSLYSRILIAKKLFKQGASMVADHGMNPGLISHFTMMGIRDFAEHMASSDDKYLPAVALAQQRRFAECAQVLNIKVIHITECDTQLTHNQRPKGIFWNTWSSEGLLAESLDPVQIGLGTSDDSNFPKKSLYIDNMCIMPIRGMDLLTTSMTPGRTTGFRPFTGYSIPHGEANTISAALTVDAKLGSGQNNNSLSILDDIVITGSKQSDSDALYRPSVFFVYQPCKAGRASLEEIRRANYVVQKKFHVLSLPQIKTGYDAIGALLITPTRSWWCGTVLDVTDMHPHGIKFSGPTTIQVAISLISALKWLLVHPTNGFMTPEDLPYDEILRDALPYLGRIYSGLVDMPKRKNPKFDTYKE